MMSSTPANDRFSSELKVVNTVAGSDHSWFPVETHRVTQRMDVSNPS